MEHVLVGTGADTMIFDFIYYYITTSQMYHSVEAKAPTQLMN